MPKTFTCLDFTYSVMRFSLMSDNKSVNENLVKRRKKTSAVIHAFQFFLEV